MNKEMNESFVDTVGDHQFYKHDYSLIYMMGRGVSAYRPLISA